MAAISRHVQERQVESSNLGTRKQRPTCLLARLQVSERWRVVVWSRKEDCPGHFLK